MFRYFLKSKLKDITVTDTLLEYEGSIMVDQDWLDKANIAPFEQVDVLNLNNGSRITTYAIAGPRGSKVVQLNGPAARAGIVGDRVIVLAYCALNESEVATHKPAIFSVTHGIIG